MNGNGVVDKSLNVIVKPPKALTAHERAAWGRLRAANPALYSPYFHFEYTDLVGTLRDDIRVAIVTRNSDPIAFFPYQASKNSKTAYARPVGAPMTDYHGFIQAPGTNLDATQILENAGVGAFHFNALVDTDKQFTDDIQSIDDGTMLDISQGADAWRKARESSYRRALKSHRRRVRKTEEEYGKRRFVFKSRDRDIFDQLITWKKQKFQDTGKYDVLSNDWTYQLLEKLLERSPKAALRADMHALYFGDRLSAIDLGLTDGLTFHSWIVGYNNDFHTLAPGIQLLEGLIDAASMQGYQRIDLGAGTDGYKRHYASEPVQVASGFVAIKGAAAALSQIYGAAERLSENAPIGSLSKVPGKMRRRYSQIAACDSTLSGRAKALISAVATAGKG